MARKQAAEIRAAAQQLAPIARSKPQPEPVLSEVERIASRERVERLMREMRDRLKGKPKARPIEHWRKIISSPYACSIAKKMAKEALDVLEPKINEAERIAVEAEMQETARRIAKAMSEESQKLSTGENAKPLTD